MGRVQDSIGKRDEIMSKANARWQAIQTVQNRKAVKSPVDYTQTPVGDLFGANVFNRAVMRTLLPKNAYVGLTRCLDHGDSLDPSLADIVANAMKDWAISSEGSLETKINVQRLWKLP